VKSKIFIFVATGISVAAFAVFAVPRDGSIDIEKALEKMELYVERNSVTNVRAVFSFFTDLVGAPLTAADRADGTYRAESVPDDYHYRHVVRFEVKGGRFVGVDYDEIKTDGTKKQSDSAYNARMIAGAGTSPAVAYPLYESQLVEKQNLKSVNAVTGATYSLHRFRVTVIRALLAGPGDSDSTASRGERQEDENPGGLRDASRRP
jgi:major membrane immunogen (membrane-anchored lipoprotein)